jgi:hypothetical protein
MGIMYHHVDIVSLAHSISTCISGMSNAESSVRFPAYYTSPDNAIKMIESSKGFGALVVSCDCEI